MTAWVVINLGLPQLLASQRVDRLDVRSGVAKIGRPAVPARTDHDGRPNGLACAILPIRTAALGIERIDLSILAADKHAPAENRRLRHLLNPERRTNQIKTTQEAYRGHQRVYCVPSREVEWSRVTSWQFFGA
jgi:hypothetical protein